MIKEDKIMYINEKLNYEIPSDYYNYYFNQSELKIKPNLFKVNGVEKIIRHLYSLDDNSRNYILKFQYIDSDYSDKIVPFAELEFGDLLCFERDSNNIVYYDHEQDSFTFLAKTWEEFIKLLY